MTNKQNINGVLLLNKPLGITSNAALQTVKRFYNARKAGHTGSLDPLASGMLPICFGEATKFSQFLLAADKYYQASARLGIKTTTGDAEGEIIAERGYDEAAITQQLPQVLKQFQGEIAQTPSMYSALKHQGEPLYKLARRGIHIERQSRQIKIHALTLENYQAGQLDLYVHCSKGTYIRSLVEDIGEALGCGAVVTKLHRVATAPYQQQPMLALAELEVLVNKGDSAALQEKLLPLESAISDWPQLQLDALTAQKLRNGQKIKLEQHSPPSWVRMLHQGDFLGIGEILTDGWLAPRRLLSTPTPYQVRGKLSRGLSAGSRRS